MARICYNCGTTLNEGTKFCPECGISISQDKTQKPTQPPQHISDPEQDTTHIDNQVFQTSKNFDNTFLRKNKKAVFAIICLVAIVVAFVVSVVVVTSSKLNETEQHAYYVIQDYKRLLKDPDSLIIRGVIVVIEKENETYTFFTASAKNSYGGMVASTPIYKNMEYLGDYDDEKSPSEISNMTKNERDKYLEFLEARVLLASRNVLFATHSHENGSFVDGNGVIYTDIEGKKIAKKLKCGFSED